MKAAPRQPPGANILAAALTVPNAAVAGYRASYQGLVLGADRQFGDNWRAGAPVRW